MMKSLTHPHMDELHAKVMKKVPEQAFKAPVPAAHPKHVGPLDLTMPKNSMIKTDSGKVVNPGGSSEAASNRAFNPSRPGGVL